VLDEVRRIARELKQKLRDERSLLQYGFTVPELIANKSFSRKEIEEIGEFVTFGAEILISTIYDNQAFIFEVRPDGEVIRQPDYGIIGTTAQASAFMQWRCVTSGDELGSVLYEVLEAKRFGEMDGNIGRDTSMYVLEPDGGLHRVKSSYIQTMERRRAKVDKDRLKIQFSPDFLVTKPEDLGFTP
jgi:20S proteasome alpha/beta subunit